VRPPRHSIEILASLNLRSRLPESLAIQDDIGIAADYQAIRGSGGGGAENVNLARRYLPLRSRNRLSLPASILDHLEVRVPPAQLIDARDDDVELDSQLFENLPPLRRPRS
jgi:hypothetical protein